MALIDTTPSGDDNNDTSSPEAPPVKIECEIYRGITVDTKYTPSSALLIWIEGSNWTVDYYSQFLDKDTEPTPQSLDRDAPWQQYRHIKQVDLKVTQDLSYDQDGSTHVMTTSGSGYTFPFMVPNYGDMFVADVGDGRTGVFTITSTRRATIRKDSVYEISYEMVGYHTPERQADFDRKTVETLVYSRKSLYSGCGPFLTPKEDADGDRYQDLLGRLLKLYLSDFYSYEHSVLLVPDQPRKTYDHFVTQFVINLMGSQADDRLRKVRVMNVTAQNVMRQPTLWSALLMVDPVLVETGTRQANLVSTTLFKGRPEMQALGFMGIPYLVYPQTTPSDVDSRYDNEDLHQPEGSPLTPGQARRRDHLNDVPTDPDTLPWYQRGSEDAEIPPALVPPDLYPVTQDSYYVLSEAFYQQTSDQSKLELLTRQFLEGDALNTVQLDQVLTHVYDWTALERFYYYPILFVLLKSLT